MTMDCDIAVIGGGVIGLAVAKALCDRGATPWVLEAEAHTGEHTSSRNSQVIHAGLYYPPGSVKAHTCVDGKHRLYQFARDNGVAHARCGKLLVATTHAEIERLEALRATAELNGVDDLEDLTADQARQMEPEVACVRALHSPSSGIIDTHGLMVALEGHIGTRGGEVITHTHVDTITPAHDGHGFTLTTQTDGETTKLNAERVIIAGGHGAASLMRTLSDAEVTRTGYTPPNDHPTKGHYFTLSGKSPFKRLIYPMPSGAWLGIHATIDLSGAVIFGPDHQRVKKVDYNFDEENGTRQARFEDAIRHYWPALPAGRLQPGYVGVRPKIYTEGDPPADFTIHDAAIHGLNGLIALFGIESPGLTASLSLAEMVADRVLDK